MAMKKLLTSDNGAQARYHRIQSIDKDCNKIRLVIDCYTDSSYRQQEKDFAEMQKVIDTKVARISYLTGAGELSPDERHELAEIQAYIDRFRELSEHGAFYLFQTTVTMLWSDMEDISFHSIYEKLAENNEIFAGAENC